MLGILYKISFFFLNKTNVGWSALYCEHIFNKIFDKLNILFSFCSICFKINSCIKNTKSILVELMDAVTGDRHPNNK